MKKVGEEQYKMKKGTGSIGLLPKKEENKMNPLVVGVFTDTLQAEHVRLDLLKMKKKGLIDLDAKAKEDWSPGLFASVSRRMSSRRS